MLYYTGVVQKSRKPVAVKRPPNLSSKNIPANERLILALDLPSSAQARDLVTRLDDTVMFYKLGLQLFMAATLNSCNGCMIVENRSSWI